MNENITSLLRCDLKDLLLGKNKNIDMALHDIHTIRQACEGHETEECNIVPLLRARIAELEWLYNEQDCMMQALRDHVDSELNKIKDSFNEKLDELKKSIHLNEKE